MFKKTDVNTMMVLVLLKPYLNDLISLDYLTGQLLVLDPPLKRVIWWGIIIMGSILFWALYGNALSLPLSLSVCLAHIAHQIVSY